MGGQRVRTPSDGGILLGNSPRRSPLGCWDPVGCEPRQKRGSRMGEMVDERMNRSDVVMEMGRVEGGPSARPG